MKLSASKWLSFLSSFSARDDPELQKRQSTSLAPTPTADGAPASSISLFPAPPGTFTLPPGPQTLVVSADSVFAEERESTTTYITQLSHLVFYVTTEGPTIFYSDILRIPWATLYVEGDPTMVISQTAMATTTASILTSLSCSESICSPTPTSLSYTCGIVGGSTQPVTTVMQSYHCTTGQTCEGEPVKTILTCDCGSPICTTALPLVPLVPIVVPLGAPIPPAVPDPPDIPEPGPEPGPETPETTISGEPTTSSQTPETSSEESSSSDTSTTSSDTSSSSSSSSSGSSSSSSSSSSVSACSYGAFSIPDDFESTLSAWLSQYPIVMTSLSPEITSPTNSASLTSSTSTISSSGPSITPPSITTIPTPSPSPTPAPTPTPTSSTTSAVTLGSCDAACSSSSASSAFEAGLSRSMAAGHSSVISAFSSAQSAQSASIASASSAQAISTCQHYTLGYPWNPPDIPVSLATYGGQSQYGSWMCVINPNKIDTNQNWNSTWEYQPFAIDRSWDRDHPTDTLVDTFCNYLVNEKADVTPNGNVQGVCQAYDMGQCLNPTRSGQCTYWEHPWTTLDTWGPVMISVSYDAGCPLNAKPMPVDFGAVGAGGCKQSLQALVDNCSFPPNLRNNWAAGDPVVGGTIWADCMVYTIVGIKEADKPNPIWQF